MPTQENLKAAFAGESQANRKYLAFAARAEVDGFPQIARLFRAVAAAETVHAHAHLRAMKGIGDTRQNLQAAIEGEEYEFAEMYPKFVGEAETEGHGAAVKSFRNALAVERTHYGFIARPSRPSRPARISNPLPCSSATSAVTRWSATCPTLVRCAARPGRSFAKSPDARIARTRPAPRPPCP